MLYLFNSNFSEIIKKKHLPCSNCANSVFHLFFFFTCRKSCDGLDVVSQGEEVHGQGHSDEEETSESEDTHYVKFSHSGLHRLTMDPAGSETTALYVITETRLRDLVLEARSLCSRCSRPLEVGVVASGLSAHITWVSNFW